MAENKGLKRSSWRKSAGGTPLSETTSQRTRSQRAGSAMEEALRDALTRMRSAEIDEGSEEDAWSDGTEVMHSDGHSEHSDVHIAE